MALSRRWYGPGNKQLWGDDGTYQAVDLARLPRLTVEPRFEWLPPRHEKVDYMQVDGPQLSREDVAKRADGFFLPAAFLDFITNAELCNRIASCTLCSWQVGSRVVTAPNAPNTPLLRFMHDQQFVLSWYLALDGVDAGRIVVAEPEWLDEEDAESADDAMRPQVLGVCAESFEEHVKRFWIENLLWYAVYHGSPALDGELRAYLDAATATR